MSNRTSNSPVIVQGVYVALATPRHPDSVEADASALLDYIDTITRTGVDGLVLFGSTGEFIHYDMAERMRVLSLAVKRARVPMIANVSHSSFAAAVDLAENAIETGAAGILLMPPYFFHYSENQIFSFYESFLKIIGGAIPVYLYNIPAFTNPMSAPLLNRLLSTGSFAGIKDSSGDWALFEAIRSARAETPFQNLTGNDRLFRRARSHGADGVVSGVAAALPELLVALDRALSSHDENRIDLLDAHLQEFIRYIDKFPATIGIKQAAVVRGWKQDHAALPFDPQTKEEIRDFHHWFEQWLPGVLEDTRMRT